MQTNHEPSKHEWNRFFIEIYWSIDIFETFIINRFLIRIWNSLLLISFFAMIYILTIKVNQKNRESETLKKI